MIIKLVLIPIIILAFFYPFISLTLLVLGVIVIFYMYYSTSKETKIEINSFKREIVSYFDDVIGDGLYHFNYVKQNSMYFINPGATKFFKRMLDNISLTMIIVAVIYFFRFDEFEYWISIATIVLAVLMFYISLDFTKPITEYQIRNSSTFSNKDRKGLEEYPEFFYHGEYARIKKMRNDEWLAKTKGLIENYDNIFK